MAKLTVCCACLLLAACNNDSSSTDATTGGITAVTAGDGLTGGGSSGAVSLAVDYTKVAKSSHTHAFTDLTGVPNAATAGSQCGSGQKATGINVAAGTVSCVADSSTDTLGALSCSEGAFPELIGGKWTCGGFTVHTGAGLTGGPISGSGGTLAVDFNVVATNLATMPGFISPWTVTAADTIRFDGSVGIGVNPIAALVVDNVAADLYLHDRAGGASAAIFLDDADNTGETLNIVFQRSGSPAGQGQIFLAADDSMAFQLDNNAYRFKTSASKEAMRITADGFMGIGTPTPTHLLEVSNGASTAFCDGATWVNASTRAAKEGIRNFARDDYATIRKLLDQTQVVWYRYKNDKDPRTRVGLIAEDVPEVLATADRKGIATADAIGFLTAAAKDLAAENERLKQENDRLNDRLAQMEARLSRLEAAAPAGPAAR